MQRSLVPCAYLAFRHLRLDIVPPIPILVPISGIDSEDIKAYKGALEAGLSHGFKRELFGLAWWALRCLCGDFRLRFVARTRIAWHCSTTGGLCCWTVGRTMELMSFCLRECHGLCPGMRPRRVGREQTLIDI